MSADALPLRVVLVRPEGNLNLGSVARLCDNFGCDLVLVDPRANPSSEEATMMAFPSEGLLRRARITDDLATALVGASMVVGTSSKIAEALDEAPLSVSQARAWLPPAGGCLALVFGNERLGLTRAEAAACHRVMRLHTPGPRPSLNLSHAVAAALQVFALATLEESDREPSAVERASPMRREALLGDWLAALEHAGYFRSQTPAGFSRRLRRVIDRLHLSGDDARLLQGMLRHFRKEPAAPERPGIAAPPPRESAT